ncbi:hypothetical protein KPH14_010183 [Odynerus spinipes]|uniref:Cytochrome P450 n=1 Tax=Odynerus spinipes TaxID=1348599 RepID=A0AAD9VSP4_9HYME|nr:hypothetical protein KPH14_010183 [Odynerus spinipes]
MRDVWIYIVALSSVYVLYRLRNYIRTVVLAFKLKGPPALPVIGNAHLFFRDDPLEKLGEYQPNTIMKFWISIIPFVLVVEPKDIQLVLGSTKHNNKSFIYGLFRNFLGNGLVVNEDEIWKQHRKLIQPIFNGNRLERFTKIFAEYAEYLTLDFADKLDQDINVTKLINDIVYNIQSKSILGLNTRQIRTEKEKAALPFKKNQMFALYRLFRPWLLIDWVYKMTETSKDDKKQMEGHAGIVYKILKETEEATCKNFSDIEYDENSKGSNERLSLLEYMIELKEKYLQFTDKDIVDECGTFMLAGMESVSTSTAITLFLLANHKEWQEKCVDELNEILNDDDAAFVSTKALKEMKCLEMCIKESLRLYPSIPLISRRLNEDEKLGGHIVPAGCNIFISPSVTQRLPHYFPDPNSFRPERFDSTNSREKIHPYAYIPFGIGPRNCIGYKFAMLEMKMLICTILRNFVLEPVKDKDVVQMRYRMTLRAHGGLWIKFKTRSRGQGAKKNTC